MTAGSWLQYPQQWHKLSFYVCVCGGGGEGEFHIAEIKQWANAHDNDFISNKQV